MNLTRAGATSDQQGDQIQDIMIWAFDLNDGMNCVGWRQYTPPTTTYTTLSLHVPAKTCGDQGGQYRLVALLNRNTFTDADGNVIPLGRNTTYNDLISGKFVSPAVMDAAIVENTPGSPAIMPISHWMDVEVRKTNTHDAPANASDWSHLWVNMPVYRTVAKSQFLMAKKGADANFDLKVISLKLINNAMPTDGLILSSVIGDGLSAATATPKWDWNPVGVADENKDDDLIFAPATSTTQGVYTLVNADTEETANNAKSVNAKLAGHDQTDEGSKFYTPIGSHFIYETTEVCEYTDNATSAPSGNGYYYEVKYTVEKDTLTRYVGIPNQIARNHDYQVRALVDAGGKLSLNLVVNEWDDVTQGWDYIDVATLDENGKLRWNDTTTVGDDLETKYKLDDEGNEVKDVEGNPVVDYYYRNVTTTEAKTDNQIDIAKCATCTFNIQTPTGGTWYAMFANGDINSFEFVREDGTSLGNTASGNVGSEATLRIRATKSASEINRAQQALLDVVVKTADGRTIKVNGLMVDPEDPSQTIKYQMVQNKN